MKWVWIILAAIVGLVLLAVLGLFIAGCSFLGVSIPRLRDCARNDNQKQFFNKFLDFLTLWLSDFSTLWLLNFSTF